MCKMCFEIRHNNSNRSFFDWIEPYLFSMQHQIPPPPPFYPPSISDSFSLCRALKTYQVFFFACILFLELPYPPVCLYVQLQIFIFTFLRAPVQKKNSYYFPSQYIYTHIKQELLLYRIFPFSIQYEWSKHFSLFSLCHRLTKYFREVRLWTNLFLINTYYLLTSPFVPYPFDVWEYLRHKLMLYLIIHSLKSTKQSFPRH